MNLRPGQELKKIRESKGITLEKAAADTCLRTDLLRQLEDEETVDAMPEIYRKLSLRMYARYLEVPVNHNRTVTRESGDIALSPVDGCVELAYSESLRGESEPKKRRTVGPGTVLAVSTSLILTIGLGRSTRRFPGSTSTRNGSFRSWWKKFPWCRQPRPIPCVSRIRSA